MGRKKILPLILCFLMLASCAPPGSAGFGVREKYEAMPELSLKALVRVDFGDRILDFSVNYTCDPEGKGRIEVISPESIAGIEAEVGDAHSLTYQGTTLELGALAGTGLSPMECLPLMVSDWSLGYLTGAFREKQGTRNVLTLTYRSRRQVTVFEHTAYFDPDTLAPISGELYIDGNCVVTVWYE